MARVPAERVPPEGAPPRPVARKPRLKLPRGSCDTHFHCMGPWNVFPYAEGRRFTPHDAPKEEIFAMHRHLGLDRGVAVQSGSAYGTDISALVDLLKAGKGNYRGVAVIDGPVDDPMLQGMHDAGVRGVRYYNMQHLRKLQPMDDRRRLADRIGKLGWHIVFFGDIRQGTVLDDFLSLGLPVILDHMTRYSWDPAHPAGVDQPDFQALLKAMRHDRLWVKIACQDRISSRGAPFADVRPYARAIVQAAPDRVIWGTDYPHNHHKMMPDEADLVDFVADVAPEPEVMQKLMVDNPARLYGW
jgi:2-pyrone-4,6-dicarboxylate lactonase